MDSEPLGDADKGYVHYPSKPCSQINRKSGMLASQTSPPSLIKDKGNKRVRKRLNVDNLFITINF